eukprot:scaffold10647_cov113-Isochrysis_galbana.AAC.5
MPAGEARVQRLERLVRRGHGLLLDSVDTYAASGILSQNNLLLRPAILPGLDPAEAGRLGWRRGVE